MHSPSIFHKLKILIYYPQIKNEDFSPIVQLLWMWVDELTIQLGHFGEVEHGIGLDAQEFL
jgi:hypothetical protein